MTTAPQPALPVTVLCGFLGSGKTTLLKRVLDTADGERIGVLVNDFGAINIDAALIAETGVDQIALTNGCICCSIRDDLGEALERLLAMQPRPERIVVEASGVSRPLAIMHAIDDGAFAGRLVLEATVCLVDTDQFPSLDFTATELAIDQAGSSDLLILNKCDLATPESIAATEAGLIGPNSAIRHIRTSHANVPTAVLFGNAAAPSTAGAREMASHAHTTSGVPDGRHAHDREHATGHHHHSPHDELFESWHWHSEEPLDPELLRTALRDLPKTVLRAKGLLCVSGAGGTRRGVLQLVGKRATLTVDGERPPETSDLVWIAARGTTDWAAIATVLDACRHRSDTD